MLTIQECLSMCGLTEDEVRAIAQHEHIPEIVAAELGSYLVRTAGGETLIARMIADDIEDAQVAGDIGRAAALKIVLQHFAETHPSK